MTTHWKALLMATLLSTTALNDAAVAEVEQPKSMPKYRLVDLGLSGVDLQLLTKNSISPTLAPAINDLGQIMGNRLSGGFVRQVAEGEWHPHLKGVTLYFHALTQNGDVLVSLQRPNHATEWAIWPSAGSADDAREFILLEGFSLARFYGLTNERKAIGVAEIDGVSAPIYSASNAPLSFLKDPQGQNSVGIPKSINTAGQIAGYIRDQSQLNSKALSPAVWTQSAGWQPMRNFRSKPLPNGEAELADLAIAEDGTVYGTYRIKFHDSTPQTPYFAYAWHPFEEGDFKPLDLHGMRISGLNDKHTLVGSLDGEASLCEPGSKPFPLSAFISPAQMEGWQLLEATEINNSDAIVGYGKFKGEVHLFLAQRVKKE